MQAYSSHSCFMVSRCAKEPVIHLRAPHVPKSCLPSVFLSVQLGNFAAAVADYEAALALDSSSSYAHYNLVGGT